MNTVVSLVGKKFAHFQADGTGRHQVRMGVVAAQIGPTHYLLEFQAERYAFSNVFAAADLGQFVFFLTDSERQAFLLDLTDRVVDSLPSLAKTNAGRGKLGTQLTEGAA